MCHSKKGFLFWKELKTPGLNDNSILRLHQEWHKQLSECHTSTKTSWVKYKHSPEQVTNSTRTNVCVLAGPFITVPCHVSAGGELLSAHKSPSLKMTTPYSKHGRSVVARQQRLKCSYRRDHLEKVLNYTHNPIIHVPNFHKSHSFPSCSS